MKTILLVEDNFLNRRLSKKVLTENGYAVLEAKNAAEALDILKKEPITLIILDINLGEDEQDGISLGQIIKGRFSVPFLYLTAYDNADIIGKAVTTSPYSYITKPFKNSDLIASVEIAIRKSANEPKHQPAIMLKDGNYNIRISVENINYIESDGNYLLFHTDEKVYKNRCTIKKMLEELSGSVFVQTHRAYIVNRNKIKKFNSRSVMVGETAIPVSENFMENVKYF